MKNELKVPRLNLDALITLSAILLLIGAMSAGCKASDDIDSYFVCKDYCSKKFDCESANPSTDEKNACVDDCRSSIENDCGNDHQAAANDRIAECVDKSCVEFWSCMVFEASPACFGFVN